MSKAGRETIVLNTRSRQTGQTNLLPWRWLLLAGLLAALSGFTLGAAAQEISPDPPQAAAQMQSPVEGLLSEEEITRRIQAVQDSPDADDAQRARITEFYQQALAATRLASERRAAERSWEDLLSNGRQQIEDLQAKTLRLERDDLEGPDVPADASSQQLLPLLEQARAQVVSLGAALDGVNQSLREEEVRPAAIRQEIARQNAALTELRSTHATALQDTTSAAPVRDARLAALHAQEAAVQAHLALLQKELLARPINQELLQTRRRALSIELRQAESLVAALASRYAEAQRVEADAAILEAGVEVPPAAAGHPLVLQLQEANLETGALLRQLSLDIERTLSEQEAVALDAARVNDAIGRARSQLEIAGANRVIGPVLFESRRELPDLAAYRTRAAERDEVVSEASLRGAEISRELLRLDDPKRFLAEQPGLGPETDPAVISAVEELLAARRGLLLRATKANTRYLQELLDLSLAEQQMSSRVAEFKAFLDERLLWVRTQESLGLKSLGQIREEMRILANTRYWKPALQGVLSALIHPLVLITLLGLAFMQFKRRAMISKLQATAEGIGKVSVDTFQQTLLALGLTIAIALPIPLMLLTLGQALTTLYLPQAEVLALGASIKRIAPVVFFLGLLRAVCLPGGLAEAHFRWDQTAVRRLRGEMTLLLATFLAPAFLMVLTVARIGSMAYGETSRLLLLLLLGGLALFLYRLMHPVHGIVAMLRDNEPVAAPRSRAWLWLVLVMAVPLLLAGAVALGYMHSAGTLLTGVVDTLWLLVVLVLAQESIYRWLLVARRRLRLRQVYSRREAAREAGKDSNELSALLPPSEEAELDLVALDADSRTLVRTGLVLMGAIALLAIWADLLPALSVLENIHLWSTTAGSADGVTPRPVTLADLALALLLLFAVVIGVRTVPSALEIALRQRADIVRGSRLAAATLVRYTIVVVGAFIILNLLGVTWGRLQWLVAALGVGIGFGLQEIVANFISGLIILVERPVRVGDVVTVGEVEGVVTRIQIRATTVKNWNGQEHLVPNKEFITGRVLNWSLSDEVTRLVIPIGIAYGSDVEKALDILRKVAREHPKVLEDPAPFVGFFAFGDNALNLEVRAFVKNIGDRLTTQTDLYLAIEREFRAAGIQISFPQRDVHLDTLRPLEVTLRREPRKTGPEPAG